MENPKVVELVATAPKQSVAAAGLRPCDSMLQNRFRRALQESPPSQAADSHATQGSSQPQSAPAVPTADSNAELSALLERVCSAMYVGDSNVQSQRIVLMLDHVLAGASAEIVRQGVHLTVRLHASTLTAHRLMSSQRAGLVAALDGSDRHVDVVIVHGARAANDHDRAPG